MSYYHINGVKNCEPLPQPVYGQRILGNPVPHHGCDCGKNGHQNDNKPVQEDPNEFLPGGVPDHKGRKNLNAEFQHKRDLMEEILQKEQELRDLKKEFVE